MKKMKTENGDLFLHIVHIFLAKYTSSSDSQDIFDHCAISLSKTRIESLKDIPVSHFF